MNQMNQIVLEGNVVRDSLVKETPRGTRVCIVPIATNHRYRDSRGETQNDVAFFDVEAWGENFSSRIAQLAKKGRGLRVIGRLKQDRWKTQEGKNSSKVYIIAEHIDFQFPKNNEKSDSASKTNVSIAADGLAEETCSEVSADDILEEGGDTVF
ncbi:MAG: single-stranded DNA-binding protein [Treponema sp.]|nr:single-stranded DNA-binding protein [Treponema sp.]MBR1537674.1 single-stranded DNA-binding protein [Treponema sp.]